MTVAQDCMPEAPAAPAAASVAAGPVLQIEGVGKSFGGFRVLRDVSIAVPAGGLVGLIGPNGAGKSTLFSIVTGFIAPDAGAIRLHGGAVDALSPVARARAGMARTFQVPREFARLSVRENLLAAMPDPPGERLFDLFFRPRQVRAKEDEAGARADRIIGFLHLERVAHLPAGQLSGGQKKLLELGRVLMTQPGLILLDEPFAGVNPVLIEEIIERIAELNRRGIAFLVIEHDLEALTRLVSRLVVMDYGTIIAEGAPQAVLADARVREAYLGGAA
jgi:branched-chain amino acid transport system ATP-binding protein